MLKNLFSKKNTENSEIFINKKLASNVYTKFYNRTTITKEDKYINILDNDSYLLNLKVKKSKPIGKSFSFNIQAFQNQFNKKLKFNYLSPKNLVTNSSLKNLFFLFLRQKKSDLNSFYLKKRKKNGIIGSSINTLGFVPDRYARLLICNFVAKLNSSKDNNLVLKKKVFFKDTQSLKTKMIVSRSKVKIAPKHGFSFLKRKSYYLKKRTPSSFMSYFFFIPQTKKLIYAFKKRNKNKIIKSKDKKFKKFSNKKRFKTLNKIKKNI